MNTHAQNPSVALAGGKPVPSLSSLVLRLLASDRLAVAVWFALFLLACHLDEADYRLVHSAQATSIPVAKAVGGM